MDAQRFDAVPIRAVRTSEGYIKDSPIIGRSGVQEYRTADGRRVKEYRPQNVIFSAQALAALRGIPVVDQHPGAVNSANVRQHIVGTVLSEGRQDGNAIVADVMIYDTAPIDKAGRKELSLGYSVRVDETPGVSPEGEAYDQRVEAILSYNHLGIVERGRAGIARLRLDGDDAIDAVLAADEAPEPSTSSNNPVNRQEGQTMAEPASVHVRVDGIAYTATPELASVVDRLRQDAAQAAATAERVRADAAASADKARADAASVVEKARADAAEAAAKTRAELDVVVARADAAEAQRDAERARADAAEARIPQVQAEAAAAVRARLALEASAKQHGVDVRADASDLDLKSAVILKLAPAATLAGKSPEYISARLDAELERAATQHANGAAQVAAAAPAAVAARADAQVTGDRNDAETAYAEYVNELQTRWKGAA